MQKRVSRTIPHIITVSGAARKDICREFNLSEDIFSIIPNGINTDLFYPIDGIEREKNRIIVTNSADTPLKGLHYLLPAVAEIAKTRDVHLVVVGKPKKNSIVEKLVGSLEISDRVTFTGRISNEEFVKEYAKATMAVIPSVYEGFGLPAGEAMACAVPVISTSGGALPEVVGDAGVIVPPGDTKALESAIRNLLDSPDFATQLGHAGYRRVQQHLTWEAAAKKTIETYRKVIRDYH
jgi:glycosyltransferase involved in cell wall biosynthesis